MSSFFKIFSLAFTPYITSSTIYKTLNYFKPFIVTSFITL